MPFVVSILPSADDAAGGGFLPLTAGQLFPPQSRDPAIGPSIAEIGINFCRSVPADWRRSLRVPARLCVFEKTVSVIRRSLHAVINGIGENAPCTPIQGASHPQ